MRGRRRGRRILLVVSLGGCLRVVRGEVGERLEGGKGDERLYPPSGP